MITVVFQIHMIPTVEISCACEGLFSIYLCHGGRCAGASILNHLGTFKDVSSIRHGI